MIKRQRSMGKGSSSQAESDSDSPLLIEQHLELFLSRSIIIERRVALADFNDLGFEDRLLPKIIVAQGWVPYLQRMGVASMDLV